MLSLSYYPDQFVRVTITLRRKRTFHPVWFAPSHSVILISTTVWCQGKKVNTSQLMPIIVNANVQELGGTCQPMKTKSRVQFKVLKTFATDLDWLHFFHLLIWVSAVYNRCWGHIHITEEQQWSCAAHWSVLYLPLCNTQWVLFFLSVFYVRPFCHCTVLEIQ